jgi:hypothetical protein
MEPYGWGWQTSFGIVAKKTSWTVSGQWPTLANPPYHSDDHGDGFHGRHTQRLRLLLFLRAAGCWGWC